MSYAELVCRSAFSFHEGASTPEELVDRACSQGLHALAITDRDAVYGIPRAFRHMRDQEAERLPALISGALVTLDEGPGVALLARTREGWAHLCRILTRARCGGMVEEILVSGDTDAALSPHGRTTARKGRGTLSLEDLLARSGGLEAILLGSWSPGPIRQLREAFGPHCSLAITRRLTSEEDPAFGPARQLSRLTGVPLVATSDVVMHARSRKALQDVLTCIRLKQTVDSAGRALDPNAERSLRTPGEMARLFAAAPEALARTIEIADRCEFRLSDLAYRYPREVVPEGHSPMGWLHHLTMEGLAWRYPEGVPPKVTEMIAHELRVIDRLDFPAYFLTVYDSVRYARERGILCQGRGSAANSAVCYALGITSVDPAHAELLFERFISEERGEPPDIDVDFEHERREEVIQYIYGRYGRHRAAMVNEVIAYRRKSAIRDVGKALGLSLDQIDRLTGDLFHFDSWPPTAEQLGKAGIDPEDRRVRLAIRLAQEIKGMPRHVGVHVGGFTISDGPLIELCPVEPATMEDRTVIQWDKDDIDVVGFVKVDLLSLGMLTAIRKCFDLIAAHGGPRHDLATVPREDPAVYDMLCKADTVGIFQIESRAQMSMLPRLKPRCWYDLVIEVSIVRPGPIQGGMVHPYLARRNGEEPVRYAHDALVPILARTLGVPIFQEQVMAMAVAVGGFTPGEADQLRRAMGAWRKRGGLEVLTDRLMRGMEERGIPLDYAEQIASQIRGFGEYGFPESHAASFARLVYVSAWLKRYHPAAFTVALINSQPMGFYSPRSLVGDVKRHGVELRSIDIQRSDWDCTLEPATPPWIEHPHAIRLGLRLVRGLGEAEGLRIEAARARAPFQSIGDLARRAELDREALTALAQADALAALCPDRRQAVWAVRGLIDLPLFRGLLRQEEPAPLPAPTPEQELQEDFRLTGLSVRRDPVGMVRPELDRMGVLSAAVVLQQPADKVVRIAGLVSNRQRPGTASGIVFMTMEDETGMLNLVIKPRLLERQRDLILGHNLLMATAKVQRDGDSISLLVLRFAPLAVAPEVQSKSRDFH